MSDEPSSGGDLVYHTTGVQEVGTGGGDGEYRVRSITRLECRRLVLGEGMESTE